MLYKLNIILLFFMLQKTTIYKFDPDSNTKEWRIINDGVMGGLSESKLSLTDKGHGKFEGHVSLANNGGFASVMLNTDINLQPEHKFVVLKIKGDAKTYQFRLKGSKTQPQSYVQEFKTSGEWQTIRLDISNFSPQYRGRKLDLPNFNFSVIEEVRFLIANKKDQDFKLMIDSIELE